MKLTPLEIRKQEFSKSFRGYNVEEVRAFLETVADQYDALQKAVNQLSDQVVRLETRLADYQNLEKTLQETLIKAEENARRAKATSQREAEITIREGELQAQRLLSDARRQADQLKAEILMLQSRREAFIKKLKYLMQSQIELIEVLEDTEFTEEETKEKAHDEHL
ncbi:MAG: DivIVA domain-containing protein [bacterium]